MSGFKRIISVYLTVAVILALAVSCLGTQNVAVFRTPEGASTTNSITTQEAVPESSSPEEILTLPECTEVQHSDNSITEESPATECITEECTTKESITEEGTRTEDVTEEAKSTKKTEEQDKEKEDIIRQRSWQMS